MPNLRCQIKKSLGTICLLLTSRAGFTLIELIVSISIIAILATTGIITYSQSQKGGRDAKRKADIDSIAKAYDELAYDSQSASYRALIETDFSRGGVPKPPEGGDYLGLIPTGAIASPNTFQVCAILEGGTATDCTAPGTDRCYCRQSAQGVVVFPTSVPSLTPTTLLASSTPAPLLCADGLINNGCFEELPLATSWTCQAPSGVGGSCSNDSSKLYNGAYSHRVNGGGTAGGWARQVAQGGLSLTRNANYCLSAWLFMSDTSPIVEIAIQQQGGDYGSRSIPITKVSNTWFKAQGVVSASWDDDTQLFLRIYNAGTVWFDNVSLSTGSCSS